MEHSAVLVRISASYCRRRRAFCVWLWIFMYKYCQPSRGGQVILDYPTPGNFFQKSKPSHRSLTQGCALYHSARTFDPSLHYRSFGRSLSLCLHRGLKLSGPLALAAWAKKKAKKKTRQLQRLSPLRYAFSFMSFGVRSPAGHVCILLIDIILSLICCIILT